MYPSGSTNWVAAVDESCINVVVREGVSVFNESLHLWNERSIGRIHHYHIVGTGQVSAGASSLAQCLQQTVGRTGRRSLRQRLFKRGQELCFEMSRLIL